MFVGIQETLKALKEAISPSASASPGKSPPLVTKNYNARATPEPKERDNSTPPSRSSSPSTPPALVQTPSPPTASIPINSSPVPSPAGTPDYPNNTAPGKNDIRFFNPDLIGDDKVPCIRTRKKNASTVSPLLKNEGVPAVTTSRHRHLKASDPSFHENNQNYTEFFMHKSSSSDFEKSPRGSTTASPIPAKSAEAKEKEEEDGIFNMDDLTPRQHGGSPKLS